MEDTGIYVLKNSKSSNKINNEHDKIFRKMLDVKSEASDFINEALNLKNKITENQIEKYTSSFVTSSLKNEEYYNTEGKEVLIILIEQILSIKIGEEKAKEIVKMLKGGNEDMLNCIESAYRENRVLFNNGVKTGMRSGMRSGMKSGIEKGKVEIIKELLKIKMPISQISQVTHFTEEKIKEIEKGNIS